MSSSTSGKRTLKDTTIIPVPTKKQRSCFHDTGTKTMEELRAELLRLTEELSSSKETVEYLCSLVSLLQGDVSGWRDGVYLYQDSARDHIISSQDLPLRCHYEGNDFEIDYRSLSGAINGWKEWSTFVLTRFQAPLKSVGILSSMWVCSGIEIFHDVTILNQLVSCWCATTHTFLVNWGEFSVTLKDVYDLLLLPICGITSAIEPLSKDEKDLLSALTEASNDFKKNDATCDMHEWITHFHRGNDYSLVELAACITLWLSRYVLPQNNLDSIVRDINSGSMKTISVVDASFLQLFIWERFHKLAPPRKYLKDGSPRAWSRFRSRLKGSVQLTDIVDYISEFNFRSYLSNIDAYFTLDMYDGRFWFAICLPRWLLCLQDNSKSLSWSFISYRPDRVARQFGFDQHVLHDRKAWSLEKASKSCLLGSLQVSKRSHNLFQLPCKERQGGVSSKFADLWMRQNNIWSVCQIKNRDREKGPTEGEDLTTETGAHITSQETQPVDPPGHGLVGERHVPSRSIPDDMMSAFLEGDQSVLGDICWGSNLSEKGAETHTNYRFQRLPCSANSSHDGAISGSIQTTIPVGPIPTIASFRNAHKACPSAPTDNPLVVEHIQVESEYGKDLAALVGLDSE
ncbi:hypothetical protein F8388_010809 [Cannabis sativa]|uniref:Aminotransferase-like plant mobile domain-containing protein n=1 Tax=Cannabis sativa TaxID=3483 RepID=A0A7J6HBT9_CANSA|nr:hypothetical protein G4B88_001136 [Cannabis sativa]KAF4392786.1 hypothetical protein F8388_010809 [Cannabis sativa]